MNSRKPLTVGEIEELGRLHDAAIANMETFHGKRAEDYPHLCELMFKALPSLLSMLTPPPDAAVREAVEWIEWQINKGWWEELAASKARTLLSYVRAVQSPRLTPEQVEAVKIAETLLTDTMSDYGDCEHDVGHCICKYHSGVFNLRSAFPEAFRQEG